MKNKISVNNICIGIFIHNEENYIESFLEDLAKQSIFQTKDTYIQVYLLCNGCTDNSVQVSARFSTQSNYTVLDWLEGGKSRTWNRFVHDVVSEDTQTIVFIDGDIRLPESQTIEMLVETLQSSSVPVTTSNAVKDISIFSRWNPLRLISSVIKGPHQDGSISGSLYAMKGDSARNTWLPNPCLVEDGFLAATIITNFFQDPPEMSRVKAVPNAWHFFDPPANLSEFFQHDIRLALGSELNAALYTQLWNIKDLTETQQLMEEFSIGNKIDFAITEHLKIPQNHALRFRCVLSYGWPEGQKILKGLILLPVRIAHMVYMGFAFKSAKTQFIHRHFKW